MYNRASFLAGVLVTVTLLLGGCNESQNDTRTDAEKCTDYCTVIADCDPAQFDLLFPSVAQCITNCGDTLSGGVVLTPECRDATEGVISCVGRLSCSAFTGYPCPVQAARQDDVCSNP